MSRERTPHFIRHLSAAETISDMVHAYGADVVLHVALVKSKVQITRGLLDRAVEMLVNFQPSLDTCITSEKGPHGNGSHFVFTRTMRDVDVVQASSRRAWVPIAEVDLSRPFNSLHGPLWKLRYVEFSDDHDEENRSQGSNNSRGNAEYTYEGALLFTIHQTLVDGMCMFDLIYRQLLVILNGIVERGDLSIFHNPVPLLHPPEVAFSNEPLNPSKNSFKEPARMKHLSEKHQPQFRPTFTCVGNGPPLGPSVTRLLPFMLPAAATRELVEKCYEHRISPKSVIVTAAALSLGITAAANNIQIGNTLTVCLPIDLRHYRPMPQPQQMGNWLGYEYINIVKQRNHIDLSYFWRDAKSVHENLLQQRQGWMNMSTSSAFFDHHRTIMKKIAKEQTVGPTSELRKGHFTLYDLGNCDLMTGDNRLPSQDPYHQNGGTTSRSHNSRNSNNSNGPGESVRMLEHYFASSMSDVTTIPLALTVCTYRGRLMWSLTYNGRWITRPFATRFIDRMLATIDQLTARPDEEDSFDLPMTSPPQSERPYPQQSYIPPAPPVPAVSAYYPSNVPPAPPVPPVSAYYPSNVPPAPPVPAVSTYYPSNVPPAPPVPPVSAYYPNQQPRSHRREQPVEPGIEEAPLTRSADDYRSHTRPSYPRQAYPKQQSRSNSNSPSGSLNHSNKPEDVHKLPPLIRMQRMNIGADYSY